MSDYGQFDGNFPLIEGNTRPPSFAESIGGLFGLGPIMRMMNDPALQQHMVEMMQAVIQSAGANLRMEAKLDFILRELGHDPSRFECDGGRGFGNPAALLGGYGIPGAGANPAPSGAADDGIGAPPQNAYSDYQGTD